MKCSLLTINLTKISQDAQNTQWFCPLFTAYCNELYQLDLTMYPDRDRNMDVSEARANTLLIYGIVPMYGDP